MSKTNGMYIDLSSPQALTYRPIDDTMRPTDLHLLPHFDALISLQSVSKAASQMGITQPAMSAALSKLRHIFGDPLLTRSGNQWRPTARALALHQTFRPMLDAWQMETTPAQDFDPSTAHKTFNLYATDYIQFVVMPPLLGKLRSVAPHIKLQLLPPRLHGGQEMLAENHIELHIGHYPDPPESLRARFLFEEPPCCLVRSDHPLLIQEWNLDTFLAYEHMDAVGYIGYFNSQLDALLREQNRSRRVGVVLSSYLAVAFVLASSDMIATLPASVGRALAPLSGTIALPAPVPLPPLRISMFWHERYQTDRAHSWLRQYISRELETVRTGTLHDAP
ncbi:LysR family transcriptional regulator [Allopusillimonas soli]|nr:LysR family transcriptional regulator [Allopusillimonas soli]